MNNEIANVLEFWFGSATPEKMATHRDMWGNENPTLIEKSPINLPLFINGHATECLIIGKKNPGLACLEPFIGPFSPQYGSKNPQNSFATNQQSLGI